jgi:hypothetical protein
MRSASLLLWMGVLVLGAMTLAGLGLVSGATAVTPELSSGQLGCFAAYALAFYTFLVGLGAFLRARSSSPMMARVLLLLLLFAVSVGPWIIAAIAGLLADSGAGDHALVVAASSPFYVFLMMARLDEREHAHLLVAGFVAIVGWAAVGLGLLAAARSRCASLIAQYEAALARTDALLAQEDEAASAPAQAAAEPLVAAQASREPAPGSAVGPAA